MLRRKPARELSERRAHIHTIYNGVMRPAVQRQRRRENAMAIYQLQVSVVSRGKGKSAVASAAYCAAEKITNEYDGVLHDYTKKQGVIHSEIILPDHVPREFKERSFLWNSVEGAEKSCSSRLARQIEIALPKEVPQNEQIKLVRDYIQTNFVSKGMIADFSIHDKEDGNPHVHIMLTTREIDKNGKWLPKSKKEYILDKDGKKIKTENGNYKCRKIDFNNWNDRDNVTLWRANWADAVNEKFKELNLNVEPIDHRSYKDQGKIFLPTKHLGSYAHRLEKLGHRTRRGDYNRKIAIQNKMRRQNMEKIINHKAVNSAFLSGRDCYCAAARQQLLMGKLDNKIVAGEIKASGRFNDAQIAQIIAANSPVPVTIRQAINLLNRSKGPCGGFHAGLKSDDDHDLNNQNNER